MILDDIVDRKRRELIEAKSRLPLAELKARAGRLRAERAFAEALVKPGTVSLIGELKRRSPSKGVLRERFDPVRLAQDLEAAGASALSVLTDQPFFGGELGFVREAKQFTELPVLRKDFLFEPYQIYESIVAGADAILLIVRLLSPPLLSELLSLAAAHELDALVEVHSDAELEIAVKAGAGIIGINHRDLSTFTMDLELTARLMPAVPAGRIVVAESGIHTAADVRRMQQLGVHALLIGESLMTAPHPGDKVRELFGEVSKPGMGPS